MPRGEGLAARAIRARRPLTALLRSRLASALATPHGVDHYLALVDPTWSVRQVRARVVEVRREVDDTVSLWLRPNENWRGFRPGQFVELSAFADGVRRTRCFSLSSAPEDGPSVRLTIKQMPGGCVSSWAASRARVGDLVELSQATGDFVLPEPLPPRILFVSGGSGITPVVSMARHLVARAYPGTIALLHYARRAVILGDEIDALARRHDRFRVAIRLRPASRPRPPSQRLSRDALEAWLPGWRDYEAFACGPSPLLDAARALWRAHGDAGRLRVERFTSPVAKPAPRRAGGEYRLVFARSGVESRGHGDRTLLEEAEDAGLTPAHGCRMGICQSCRSIKRAGVVRNTLTGRLDDEPENEIQICIHTPCSDVTLDL